MGLAGSGPAGAGEETLVDGVVHVRNQDKPASGVETLKCQEQWRIGSNDEILLGVISQAVTDKDGNVYLLDRQLSQIQVYAPDGTYIRTLGREGDGPGEFRRGANLIILPDGRIGVGQLMPSGVVVLNPDGTPGSSIEFDGGDPGSDSFFFLDNLACRGSYMAISGRQLQRVPQGMNRVRFIAAVEFNGNEKHRIIEDSGPDPVVSRRFVEKDEYFASPGGWALGPDGKIFTAESRDQYAVTVYAPDGRRVRVIEREFEPLKRTAEEKGRVGQNLVAIVNGERIQFDIIAEDYAECISSLYVFDNGELWVLTPRGTHAQPKGVMQTFDVFDADGNFIHQAEVACEGNAESDRVIFLDDERMILVKGFNDAVRGMTGASDEEEAKEPVELEVICYRIST